MKEPKLKTVYVCSNCGETSPRWMGRCPSCGSWNTMNEDVVAEAPKAGLSGGKAAAAQLAHSLICCRSLLLQCLLHFLRLQSARSNHIAEVKNNTTGHNNFIFQNIHSQILVAPIMCYYNIFIQQIP